MSVLDQIRKLDEQKAQLLETAKKEALKKAEAAIAELNELGFNYRLTGGPATPTSSGKRRTGIRQEVLAVVQQSADGISRADILEKLDAKGDKSAEQSVSNALAALKKQNTITGDDGIYKVVA